MEKIDDFFAILKALKKAPSDQERAFHRGRLSNCWDEIERFALERPDMFPEHLREGFERFVLQELGALPSG